MRRQPGGDREDRGVAGDGAAARWAAGRLVGGQPSGSARPTRALMLGRDAAATGALSYGAAAGDTSRVRRMANIHSQKKRILRAERERLENRRYTSTIKTYFRRLEAAVAARRRRGRRRRAPRARRDDRQGRQARRAAPQQRRAQEVPRRPLRAGAASSAAARARRRRRAFRARFAGALTPRSPRSCAAPRCPPPARVPPREPSSRSASATIARRSALGVASRARRR